ncbi:hypothetical protein J3486_15375 [Streptomyces sp. VRA16 Mangrove soil]|nr:hypothetical protein [Streptomyces sp. VRA16 Mangrove soil]
MHSYANSPVMRHVEYQVRKAARDDEIIQYRVTPFYVDDNAKLPLGVNIEAYGNKGFQFGEYGKPCVLTNTTTIWNRAR